MKKPEHKTVRQEKHYGLVHQFLEASAESYPEKIALIHDEVRITYSQINNMANHFSHWLMEQGINNGDRIVLLLENCLEYVACYYGTLKTGGVLVPLSPDLKSDKLEHIFKEIQPKVVIASKRSENAVHSANLDADTIQYVLLNQAKKDWAKKAIPTSELSDIMHNIPIPNPKCHIDQKFLASIIYTSGSTGVPKGAMLTHKNIVSNTQSICQYLRITEKDVQMVVLPFFYVMGKSLLNTHVAAGGSVVINNKFAFPAAVIQQMIKEKITAFSGVPATYAHLLHRSPLEKYRDRLESLRYCSQAGGHMSRQTKEDLRNILPSHTQIYIMYGATEASSRLSYLAPEHYGDKMGSIGRPIPGVSLQVVDANGNEVGPDVIGEIVASGPNIMCGYWNDTDASRRVLTPRGYRTGDLGFRDPDGFYYVTGRIDNMLKVGGHRINPNEIEEVLMATGLIVETVVLGIDDRMLGSKLIALVVLKNGALTSKAILEKCAEKLPKHKLPAEIKIIKSLPKSSSGKTDRAACLRICKNQQFAAFKLF
jgi:acyl-CoA synthetase (AMP-forming)/AMP-acid ligase II